MNFDLQRMMVDEADIDLVGGAAQSGARGVKRPSGIDRPDSMNPTPQKRRKAGPLSRDIYIKRPFSPVPSPSSSPVPPPVAVATTELINRPDSPLPPGPSLPIGSPVVAGLIEDKEKEDDSSPLIIAESDSDSENVPVNGRVNLPESPAPATVVEEDVISAEIQQQPKPLVNGDVKG